MTDQEINAAIAEECGWRFWPHPDCVRDFDGWSTKEKWCLNGNNIQCLRHDVPNYCHDLNAMREVEWWFFGDWDNNQATDKHFDYLKTLHFVCGNGSSVCSTARQRAEAFLRTIGKWKE